MSKVYKYFDDIVCISLDIREDRRILAKQFFQNIDVPANFFIAKRHPKGGVYGCFDSHIQILKNAYKRGLENILVFEDDVIGTNSYSEELMQKAIDFMNTNQEWDIMYFSYLFNSANSYHTLLFAPAISSNIVKFDPYTTGALCYSKRGIKKILQNYKQYIGKIPYDHYLPKYCNLNNYCLVPMIFDQNFHLESNIENLDWGEYCMRNILYPLLADSKLLYRVSIVKYYLNILFVQHNNYWIYMYLAVIIISIFLCMYFFSSNI